MPTDMFDPNHPERGWQPAEPMPEPRLWRFFRALGLMKKEERLIREARGDE